MHIDELVEHWTILDEERDLIAGKRDATRLGFVILLKFYTQHGRFPRGRSELPEDVVEHVADTDTDTDGDGCDLHCSKSHFLHRFVSSRRWDFGCGQWSAAWGQIGTRASDRALT
jgi:hypothetical protein